MFGRGGFAGCHHISCGGAGAGAGGMVRFGEEGRWKIEDGRRKIRVYGEWESGRMGLLWIGLDWVGLNCTGLNCTALTTLEKN